MPEVMTPKFREGTHGRDLRIDYPEKAKLEELCRQAQQSRSGHVVFIPGRRLSGKSDLLHTLGYHVRKNIKDVQICASKFTTSGELHPTAVDYNAKLEPITKLLDATTDWLPEYASKLIKSTNALLKTYLEGSRVLGAREQAEALGRSLNDFKEYLIDSTIHQPLVWLIDDFDKGPAGFIYDLLYELRPQLADGLRIIFVLTVTHRAKLEEDLEKASRLEAAANSLKLNNVGDWWPVRKLSKAEISEWLGNAMPGLVDMLLQSSDGYPPQVSKTWSRWQYWKYVGYSQAEEIWKRNPQKSIPLNPARNVTTEYLRIQFPDLSAEERDKYHLMLHLCALEGETFTADCIADALGEDRDDLQDLLDDHFVRSEENPEGLLSEPEQFTFWGKTGKEQTVWKYSFISPFDWLALEGDGDVRLNKQRSALIRILREIYDETDPQLAIRLARICEVIGDEKGASHYRRMAGYSNQVDQLAIQAYQAIRLLKQMAFNQDSYQSQQVYDLLIKAGHAMEHMYPPRRVFRVFHSANKIAKRLSDVEKILHAQDHCASLLKNLERNKIAQRLFSQIIGEVDKQLFSKQTREVIQSRTRLKTLKARCLQGLAEIDQRHNDLAGALKFLSQALVVNLEISSRKGEASCIVGLADISLNQEDFERAATLYSQSLEISREVQDSNVQSMSLCGLAKIALKQPEYVKASELFEQALEINREIGKRIGEAVCLYGLAEIARLRDDLTRAAKLYSQSLEINREMHAPSGEAQCIEGLGIIALEQYQYENATTLFGQALDINQVIGRRFGEAACLRGLAEIARQQDEFEKSTTLYDQALVLNREIGKRHGEAWCLYGLASIASRQEKYEKAIALYTQALNTTREIEDRCLEANCLSGLAKIAEKEGDFERASKLYGQTVKIGQEIEHSNDISRGFHGLAMIAKLQNETEKATDFYTQALKIDQMKGNQKGIAKCLQGLAEIARMRGDYVGADALYRKVLEIARVVSYKGIEEECLKALEEVDKLLQVSVTASEESDTGELNHQAR